LVFGSDEENYDDFTSDMKSEDWFFKAPTIMGEMKIKKNRPSGRSKQHNAV